MDIWRFRGFPFSTSNSEAKADESWLANSEFALNIGFFCLRLLKPIMLALLEMVSTLIDWLDNGR